MRHILVFLLSLFVAGCSGCGHRAWSPYGGTLDMRELAAQHSMRSSVKVTIEVKFINAEDAPSSIPHVDTKEGWGSGFVVSWDRVSDHSLVFTAGHVCNVPDTIPVRYGSGDDDVYHAPVLGNSWRVSNLEGETFEAIPMSIDVERDVCILDVSGWAGIPAALDTDLPPLGGRLVTSGAPHGLYGKWFAPTQEGIFYGMFSVDGQPMMGTSIPTVPGMSGSGVYYHGRVVGMLTKVRGDFEHSSYLVHVGVLIGALAEARKNWHPSPRNTSQSRK